jgi:non-heme chloroperoxidase
MSQPTTRPVSGFQATLEEGMRPHAGQPIVFSHGWPLSSDDLAGLTAYLDLHDAVHAGQSAGGGEVARYVRRHCESRVAKAMLISAITPSVLQTETNPAGVPQAAFEGLQAQLAANRSEFYRAVPSGPFYNFGQPGVEPSEPTIANWWRQGMMGGAKGQYDCVSAFIREDYSGDLKQIGVPVLVMHGEADQIVPYATAAPRAVELVQNGTLKKYPGFPHGMPTTHADTINADLLAFIQS